MSSPSVEKAFTLLRDRSIAEAPQILLKQALDASMPPGVKRYLLAEVVAFLEDDLRHLPQFGRLHPDAPGSAHLRLTFLRSLAGGYELSRDQYLKLLREAVAFTESYLTRPQWTLESFLFEEEQEADLETLRARLAYCADYAYFGRLVEEILARRKATRLTRADFRTLVARIDDQIIQQHSPREFALLTKPLFDFLLLKDAGPDEQVPLAPVLLFLEDKKMKVLKEYVQSICRLRDMTALSLDQLRLLIEDLESVKKEESTERKNADGAVEEEEPATAEPVAAPPRSTATAETVESPDATAESNGRSLPDLRELIGEKQRQRFVRHVFHKDQAYFSGVITTLNTLHTWDDAATYLKKVYSINRLDPFSEIVVEFTDLVQQRFSGETDRPR
jgi:hypothetical protein